MIIIEDKHKNEKENIINSILSVLEDNNLLTLSTVKDNLPYSCSAFYAYDKEFNLYIWTETESTHARNVRKNPKVAVNIAATSQRFGTELKGLQMQGSAEIISGAGLLKAGALYLKRFPDVSKYIKKIKDFQAKKFESAIYKIALENIKLLDEKSFGKEGYRKISIKR